MESQTVQRHKITRNTRNADFISGVWKGNIFRHGNVPIKFKLWDTEAENGNFLADKLNGKVFIAVANTILAAKCV